ncbi:MerR family transcriptional regulator [Bacillus sp. SJS]|uniref:MerR family transcriptional regulator n=1 Tax=Bacillus sp. SJS TaxID=1423321 RepID=UPI0004DD01EB|nr:MerR family transcriptional regulator [Bacillus sp. SJS]KZZ85349.1 transcriptional regulator [Bacillus sp. SJS]
MYKISEFSSMTGLSKETLRYYAEVKLLEPVFIDPQNNYRYYDNGSYLLAMLLVKLRGFGCTIQEMLTIMEDESFANLENLLVEKKKRMEDQAEALHQKINEIELFLLTGKDEKR